MMNKRLGIIVGSVLAVVGIVWIFFFKPEPKVVEEPQPVRPIKSLVVGEARGPMERTYPGRIDAIDTVLLSFEVPGNLAEKLVRRGERVTKGQVLARLNPSDYQSAVNAATAEKERAQAERDRVERLAASGNASPADRDAAIAAFNVAEADLERAEKALRDTQLKATFAGVIADDYPDQGENVTAGQAIFRLQGEDSGLEVEVRVPENHIAKGSLSSAAKNVTAFATFDFLADRKFPLTVKSFASIADPATQTFEVTFQMGDLGEAKILPGMSSTVTVRIDSSAADDTSLYAPLNAVPPDSSGQYFVWKLEDKGEGQFAATRTEVTVGEMRGDDIVITGGIAKGDRIATAGVRVLREGQMVRLLEE